MALPSLRPGLRFYAGRTADLYLPRRLRHDTPDANPTTVGLRVSDIRLFVSTETFDPESAIIRWYTACAWSHTGWLRKSDGATFSAMLDGGVGWRGANSRAKVLTLNAPGVDEAFTVALTQEGDAYDMLDILGIATGRNWEAPGKFICDKLVFWAFQKAGYPLLNPEFIPLEHFTPRDVLLSPAVQEAVN
jgi:hypothetical protein